MLTLSNLSNKTSYDVAAKPAKAKTYGTAPAEVIWCKRSIDVTVSVLGLAALSWVFPLIALAIWIDSPGPIFYRQRRAGAVRRHRDGTFSFDEFMMLKFRTMHVDAERFTGAVLAAEGDPRITRVGRFLRKTRLDELPQLLSVLRGEMTLVGPRPERPELLSDLILAVPFFEERMRDVKPGITGLAQVSLGYSGRAPDGSEIKQFEDSLLNPFHLEGAEGAPADDMRMKLLYDLTYVASLEKLSTYLRQELYIIAKTPLVMLRGLGR